MVGDVYEGGRASREAEVAGLRDQVQALQERVAELETSGPEWALNQLAFAKQRIAELEAEVERRRVEQGKARIREINA